MKGLHFLYFVGLTCSVAVTSVIASPAAQNYANSSFTPKKIDSYHNPILDYVSPDPQALYYEGFYYLILSNNREITVLKSAILTDFRSAQNKVIYRAPAGMANIWAPEIHFLRGNLYIYFAQDDGDNNNHRMYVLKSLDNDPMGEWPTEAKRMYTTDAVDYWAIDGTPMELNGQLYFVWSGWPGINVGRPQNLYIAPMSDPETISGPRVFLREPIFDWEGPFTLEGPYALQRGERTFIVFSADDTWGPDYCLGLMWINNSYDPLDATKWEHNYSGCVFSRNDEEGVFCTGHAGFTLSPDGSETWMLYHATNDVNDPGSRRVARVEKVEWDLAGFPVFPRPAGDARSLAVPSGQIQETFANPILDELSADPAVLFHNGFYYMTVSTNVEHELTLIKSEFLTDFRQGERKVVYQPPDGYQNLWASELHLINGDLYIYFCMNRDGETHRMYVIKADDANNPLGNWSRETPLLPGNDGIDGTVLQYGNGNLYYIYSSGGRLYISEMENPMKVKDTGVFLRGPKSPWECGVNEGPFIVTNEGRTFLVFSACSTWTPDYCLTMIGIDYLRDPMVPSNWWDDLDRCLFYKNPEEEIYTTGHATFTYSPDGSELWMMYHATNDPNSNEFSTRVARVQKMMWNEDKSPRFPRPSGNGREVAAPSGQRRVLAHA